MTFIDSHAHLDLPEFNGDRDKTIKRARENEVEKIITIGIGIKECMEALKIAGSYTFVYAAIGIHPHNAKTLDLKTLDFLEKNSENEKVVALGEMGLDFFRNLSPKDDQIRCFRAQLDLARSLKLPVIIHDREAHEETISILCEENARETGGVLHCFSGDIKMAFACMDMGLYISIPGTITFKKATNLHEVVKKVPLDSLLIETDSPFLAPVPFRGKRNEPAHVKLIAEKIAWIKNVSLEEVAHTTTKNAKELFSLSKS